MVCFLATPRGQARPPRANGNAVWQEAFYRGGFQREVLDGCGHFLHREQPQQVAEYLIGFLAAD